MGLDSYCKAALRAGPQVLGIRPQTVNFGSAQWLWPERIQNAQQRTTIPAIDCSIDCQTGGWWNQVANNYYWLQIICIVSFSNGVGKQKTNPGFGKYRVSLQYTQRTSGAALEDDFSYNNTTDVLSSDFTKF